MNSIVCLKEVPDTETRIVVRDGTVVEEGIQYVVNPYDEFALEEALKWQEQHGGKVTIVSLGPERARESILKGLAKFFQKGLRSAIAMGLKDCNYATFDGVGGVR